MTGLMDAHIKKEFESNGFAAYHNLISKEDIEKLINIYDSFLDQTIDAGANRSDLGAGLGTNKKVENITQIMWPSDFVPEVLQMPFHSLALKLSKSLLGEDMEMDFDMLINKAPHTNTITPWHQDAAYWVNMPDKRAVSCWLALDEATIENGCMWYIQSSHLKPIRPHRFAGKEGGALVCDADESEATPVPLSPGSCALHAGGTLHYSRGNSTAGNRRAWIINFRPKAMIEYERSQGFDHGRSGNAGDRKMRNI